MMAQKITISPVTLSSGTQNPSGVDDAACRKDTAMSSIPGFEKFSQGRLYFECRKPPRTCGIVPGSSRAAYQACDACRPPRPRWRTNCGTDHMGQMVQSHGMHLRASRADGSGGGCVRRPASETLPVWSN